MPRHAINRSLQKRAICLLVAVCALAASGCTSWSQYWRNNMMVGPAYLRPPAPVENEWIDAGDPQVRSMSDVESLWWEQFDEPVLNGLVLQAYEGNLSLREAGFRVLAARAAYNITVGGFFPQAQGAVAAYDRWVLSRNVGALSALGNNSFSVWQNGFNLSWELDVWGRLRRNIESAEGKYQASVEEYDGVLVTLIADVAQRYVDYRIASKQVADLRRLAAIQRQSLELATNRFQGGATSELDVSQATLNLAQTEASIPGYEQQARVAANALCMLLGIPPEDLAGRLGSAEIPVSPPALEAGIPADLLRRRPDVRAAERELAAQSAQIGVAEADLYPAFSINGYLGVYANEIGQLFESDSQFGLIAPIVDWKILNYGRLLNNIRQQDAKFQSLAARYQETVLRAGREAEDGIITFIKAREAAEKQRKAVAAATRSLELVQIQYKEGTVDFNRVFVVQKNLVEEQVRLNENLGAEARGMIELYRALGGGWQLRLGHDLIPPEIREAMAKRTNWGGLLQPGAEQPPAGFDAWCIWPEWLRGHKPR